MTSFQIFGLGGISLPLRAGVPRSSISCSALSGCMEATASIKDPNLQLATLASSPDDESHVPSHGSRSSRELPAMCWGGGLFPLVFHVPDSTGSMAGGGGCSSRCVVERGVLELPYRRLFQTGDELKMSLHHVMGNMTPQE